MPLVHATAPGDAAAFASRILDDQHARLIVDPGLAILWSNASAGRLLAWGRGVARHHDRLQFFHFDHELRFARFLRELGNAGGLALPLNDTGGWLLFNGRRLDELQTGYVSLVVTIDEDTLPPRYHDFEAIFGLTGAENRIVLALLRGHTADIIAAAFGLSVMTVRTHLRRIYQKLGVASREELLHRLNRYRCE